MPRSDNCFQSVSNILASRFPKNVFRTSHPTCALLLFLSLFLSSISRGLLHHCLRAPVRLPLQGMVKEVTGNWQMMETFIGSLRKAGGQAGGASDESEVLKELNTILDRPQNQTMVQQDPSLAATLQGFSQGLTITSTA